MIRLHVRSNALTHSFAKYQNKFVLKIKFIYDEQHKLFLISKGILDLFAFKTAFNGGQLLIPVLTDGKEGIVLFKIA